MLQSRMTEVKKAKDSWKFLLPSTENITRTKPVSFDNVILQAGTVDSIEVVAEEGEDILPPHQIEQALNELDRDVHSILWKLQEMMDKHVNHVLSGETAIDDVFLEEFKIDRMSVDFVNNVKQDEGILPEGEQEFVNPLQGESIFAQALEVDSLCGIPSRCKLNRSRVTSAIYAIN